MFDLPVDAYIGHSSPGRLRVKIPSKKGDAPFFNTLQALFAGLPGLQSISANPLTGSLLIMHSLDEATVKDILQSYNLSSATDDNKAPSAVHGEIATIFQGWDRQVKNFSHGALNLKAIVAITLVSAAIYQISRGKFIALPWHSALWYAFFFFKG